MASVRKRIMGRKFKLIFKYLLQIYKIFFLTRHVFVITFKIKKAIIENLKLESRNFSQLNMKNLLREI